MSDIFLSASREFGLFVAGALVTILVLSAVVRMLWRQTQQEQREHMLALTRQFDARLADKNAELSQVWSELRSERDEKRRAQATCEGLESLLRREQELTRAGLEEAAGWRKLAQRASGER